MKKELNVEDNIHAIDEQMNKMVRTKSQFGVYYAILLIIYIVATVVVNRITRSSGMWMIGEQSVPIASFAGIFSSLANICLILMVILLGRAGFITSLGLVICQFPIVMISILGRHAYNNIPGLFSNLLTLIAILAIRFNNMRIQKYQKDLRIQATIDALTGLPNRYVCSELVKDLIASNEKFALVFVDVNNFKSINDTMGHETGNEVLKGIADRFREVAASEESKTKDFVTRQGGDEYAVVIRDFDSEEDVAKRVQMYASSLEEKFSVDDCDFVMSAGFGYAFYPSDAKNIDELYACADAALVEIKRINNNEYTLRYKPEQLKIHRTTEIERKIRLALETNTIGFCLQPQYDISHKLRGFEALARMKDSDGRFISPAEFIPVAESAGLIDRVDLCVLRQAASFFGELIDQSGANDITLSVNVSVRHLMKNDFLKEVCEVLEASNVPSSQFEIEITESVMIDSVEKALQCIREIRNLGIKIAIDDFGTGYSSLSYLNNFPANLLKIDKSFIDVMNDTDSSRNYVAAIISMGHVMNFDVISEGVEEEDQLTTLRDIGCDYIQGYIWGRPIPPEEARALVMQNVG